MDFVSIVLVLITTYKLTHLPTIDYSSMEEIKVNIIVFDVPAENGGALSILTEFYNEVRNYEDKTTTWIFVLSKPEFQEAENIKVLRFPWIKKSWLHRMYFDQIIAPKLVKKYKADKIFSLQNITIPRTLIEQTLYVHQPLPFVEYRYKFKEDKLLWTYQNVISKKIYKSIRRAKKVIVQTDWLRNACVNRVGVEKTKISVIQPRINIKVKGNFVESQETISTFFYPSSAILYKNHKLIIDSCEVLKNNGINNYTVIFTLTGNENEHISSLFDRVKNSELPVRFIGSLSKEKVFEYYTKSVLIFPSYIETFGLPMLEARLHGSPILASNWPFSHDILDNYSNAYFFDSDKREQLALLMKKIIEKEIQHQKPNNLFYKNSEEATSLINKIID